MGERKKPIQPQLHTHVSPKLPATFQTSPSARTRKDPPAGPSAWKVLFSSISLTLQNTYRCLLLQEAFPEQAPATIFCVMAHHSPHLLCDSPQHTAPEVRQPISHHSSFHFLPIYCWATTLSSPPAWMFPEGRDNALLLIHPTVCRLSLCTASTWMNE